MAWLELYFSATIGIHEIVYEKIRDVGSSS